MLNWPISATQLKGQSHQSFSDAQVAIYMASVSQDWTLSRLAREIDKTLGECRSLAFKWGIPFSDYNPDAPQKQLQFQKVANGWDLKDGENIIGECRSDKTQYVARIFSGTECRASSARKAMRDLSLKIDDIFAIL